MNPRKTVALAVVLLLCLPVALAAQSLRAGTNPTMRDTAATFINGVVQSTNRNLNYITVRDQRTGQDFKIDVRSMDTRQSINVWQLRPGDRVTATGGWENADTFRAYRVGFNTYQATGRESTFNTLSGTVQNVNRNLNFITIRDDASGQNIKIDVRRMDTRESVNVWQLKPGDTIIADGAWTKRNTFRANRVSFSSQQSMTSSFGAANFVSGIVQGINRDLNYVTVRDEATGQTIKIDTRRMDTRRSINVWQLRAGDRVAVNGVWSNRDTFQADTVNF